MFALILRHKADVGTTPSGVVIVHDTNAPVLVGTTPLSAMLLKNYTFGFRLVVYDRRMNKRRERVVPPKDLDAFMEIGVGYFSQANMALEKVIYNGADSRIIEIDGSIYKLKELDR